MTNTDALADVPAGGGSRGGAQKFPAHHKWDNTFFLILVALMWLGILMGFIPDIINHIQNPRFAYPLIVYIHAVLFVGWLCLLTAQILLVRYRSIALHRTLGVSGACLAGAMVIVGTMTAVVIERLLYRRFHVDPNFFSVQLGDMILFGLLASSGIALRKSPAAHKRLMLLATLCLVDAGFSRWWENGLERMFGNSYWSNVAQVFLGNILLILALGAYDLVTRHRLYRVYAYGATFAIAGQLSMIWLYLNPWWKPISIKLIGY